MSTRWVLCLAVLGLFLGVLTPNSGASLLYNNGGPDLSGGVYSDYNDLGQEVAENFFGYAGNPNSVTITNVEWYGLYFGNVAPGADNFWISFFKQEAGSRPAFSSFLSYNVGAANRVDTGLDFISQDNHTYNIYSYSANVGPIRLNMSGHYYISIVDFEPGPWEADDWFWANSAGGQGTMWYRYGQDIWSPYTNEVAFRLNGVVDPNMPEPATFTLLGIGLTICVVRRFRKARR